MWIVCYGILTKAFAASPHSSTSGIRLRRLLDSYATSRYVVILEPPISKTTESFCPSQKLILSLPSAPLHIPLLITVRFFVLCSLSVCIALHRSLAKLVAKQKTQPSRRSGSRTYIRSHKTSKESFACMGSRRFRYHITSHHTSHVATHHNATHATHFASCDSGAPWRFFHIIFVFQSFQLTRKPKEGLGTHIYSIVVGGPPFPPSPTPLAFHLEHIHLSASRAGHRAMG